MAGMSAVGEGLLSGIGGAIAGADKYLAEEREDNRKMSLEAYRQQFTRDTELMRQQFERELDATKAGRELEKEERDRENKNEQNRLDRESLERRAAMQGGSATADKNSAIAAADSAFESIKSEVMNTLRTNAPQYTKVGRADQDPAENHPAYHSIMSELNALENKIRDDAINRKYTAEQLTARYKTEVERILSQYVKANNITPSDNPANSPDTVPQVPPVDFHNSEYHE